MKDIIFLGVIVVIIIIGLCLCQSCKTIEPIIIYEVPVCDVSSDMTLESYLQNTAQWSVKIRAYIEELINQIIHKNPYVDLRLGAVK